MVIKMKEIIFNYIRNHIDDENVVIGYDTELINDGLIDSMGLISLISFLEDTFCITIEDDDFEIDNFNSINSIVKLIERKKSSN